MFLPAFVLMAIMIISAEKNENGKDFTFPKSRILVADFRQNCQLQTKPNYEQIIIKIDFGTFAFP